MSPCTGTRSPAPPVHSPTYLTPVMTGQAVCSACLSCDLPSGPSEWNMMASPRLGFIATWPCRDGGEGGQGAKRGRCECLQTLYELQRPQPLHALYTPSPCHRPSLMPHRTLHTLAQGEKGPSFAGSAGLSHSESGKVVSPPSSTSER